MTRAASAGGGFKPGPWPNGKPPKIEPIPYPGHAPKGWKRNRKPAEEPDAAQTADPNPAI